MPRISTPLAELVEQVYAAALDPRLWESVLAAVCRAVAGKSAALVTYDFRTGAAQLHAAAGADPALLPLYEHYSPKNPFMPAVASHAHTGFVSVSAEHVDDRELFKTEYFNEYMRRAGYHHNAGLCLERVGDVATMVYPVRDLGRPPFSRRDLELCRALVPHLSRAFVVHRRLTEADARSSAASHVLEQLALGVCVLDGSGRVVFTNGAAREILQAEDGIKLGRDGLTVMRACERDRFRRAASEAIRATGAQGIRGVARSASAGRRSGARSRCSSCRFRSVTGSDAIWRPLPPSSSSAIRSAEPRRGTPCSSGSTT